MPAIRKTVKSLLAIVRSWLQVDRIRISPWEGRLLGLRPGQRILLRGRLYVVCCSPVAGPADVREVTIRLNGDAGPACLRIQRRADGRTSGSQLLDGHGRQEDILEDDVQILAAECGQHIPGGHAAARLC